jgi:excisionase family DNA binding protein
MSRSKAKRKNSKTPTPTVQSSTILDVGGVADLLKIGSPKVYDLVRTNSIPYKRIGERRLIFSESDVLHWFDNLPDGSIPLGVVDESEAEDEATRLAIVEEVVEEVVEQVEPVVRAVEQEPLRTTEMNRTLSTALKANGHTHRPNEAEEANVRLFLTRVHIELIMELIEAADTDEVETPLTNAEMDELVEASYKLEHALVGHRRHQRKLR